MCGVVHTCCAAPGATLSINSTRVCRRTHVTQLLLLLSLAVAGAQQDGDYGTGSANSTANGSYGSGAQNQSGVNSVTSDIAEAATTFASFGEDSDMFGDRAGPCVQMNNGHHNGVYMPHLLPG